MQLRADTITLKTGEKIIGTIKAETDTEVTIDVPVSDSITDERVIQKQDIAKEDKEQPDAIAYKQLIQVQPNPEFSYSSQTYGQILASLNAFETTYPNSAYLQEIKSLAAQFEDEKQRVDAGEFKYMGHWLTKDEVASRQDQITALGYYERMQQLAAAGDLVGAMQTFAAIEAAYPNTRGYVAAVSLAQQVLPRLEEDLDARMDSAKNEAVQLENTINFTAEPEKTHLKQEAQEQEDGDTAQVQAAQKSGQKWVPLIPRSQLSISTLQSIAAGEAGRLGSMKVADMAASLEKSDAAANAIDAHDYKQAADLLKEAAQLWNANGEVQYLSGELPAVTATATPRPLAAVAGTPRLLPLPSVAHATPRPSQIAATPKVARAPVEVETPAPYYMTIQGAITIAAGVLVVGGLVASYIQKKARKQAAE